MLSFLQFPRVLVTDERYKSLSGDAKLLYMLMLDVKNLSKKNGWLYRGRVYIYYTQKKIMETLEIAHDKATKIVRELEAAKLIARKKRGMGKPTMIFVNEIETDADGADLNPDESAENSRHGAPENRAQTAEKPHNGQPKNRALDREKTAPNNININNKNNNNINFIYQSPEAPPRDDDGENAERMDGRTERENKNEKLKNNNIKNNKNINNNIWREKLKNQLPDTAPEIIAIMADACERDFTRVDGLTKSAREIQTAFTRLSDEDIRQTIARIPSYISSDRRRAYMLTALYATADGKAISNAKTRTSRYSFENMVREFHEECERKERELEESRMNPVSVSAADDKNKDDWDDDWESPLLKFPWDMPAATA